MTDDPLDTLITGLSSLDPQEREAAARQLGDSGDSRAVEPLLAALANDSDKPVRRRAAEALGQLGDARAIEPLLAAASSLQAAEEALARLGDGVVRPMLAALHDPDPKRQRTARNVLHRRGYDPDNLPPDLQAIAGLNVSLEQLLAGALNHQDDELEAAIASLAQAGVYALEPALHLLRHDHSRVRQAAARVLASLSDLHDPRTVEPLLDALRDPDSTVRLEAVRALGRSGDLRAVEPLAAIARGNADGALARLHAALAVGALLEDDMLSLHAATLLDTAMKSPGFRLSESNAHELFWLLDEALEGYANAHDSSAEGPP